MQRCTLILLLFLNLAPAFGQDGEPPLNVYNGPIPEGEHTFFVAPDGDDAAAGTEEAPWATLNYAITQVERGDVIVMRGGVYDFDDTFRIQTPSGYAGEMIVVTAYPGEVPILDFAAVPRGSGRNGIRLNANYWHLIGLTIRNADHNGIRIDGSYNILEQVTAYENGDTGIHMAGGASHNLIKNCDSFRNYDPEDDGENADGFGAKFEIGPGNRYVGCRAWENSDDGWDFWRAGSTIVIDSSWAFGNGNPALFGSPDDWGGDGNGFKLGGDYVRADQVVRHSMAFDNLGPNGTSKGFDYNNNPGAMTLIHNTAYNNGRNYVFGVNPSEGQAVFLNNVSAQSREYGTVIPIRNVVAAGNSWQQATEVTDDMFVSVDTELAKSPRQADGSLPDIDLLKPAPESFLVDAGVLIAEPFYGDAPDLGAIEYQSGDPVEPWVAAGSGEVITDLKVYDMEHAGAWSIRNELAVGTELFGDEGFTIAAIAGGIEVDEWIQPAAETRAKNYLFSTAAFSVGQATQVLIAHADAITDKPEWLAEYAETGLTLTLSESGGTEHAMAVYRREVEAGEEIILGRNSVDGTLDAPMYLVMVGRATPVSVEDEAGPGLGAALHEVYPNPVSGTATISFHLPQAGDVSIKLYDAMGREVAEVAGGFHRAGAHAVTWDAGALSSGVYYCRMVTAGFSAVRKLVRIR